jgi:hypothetical protein
VPPGGATFDEDSVPPWTRGDFRGVLERTPALRDRGRGFIGFLESIRRTVK